MIHLEASQGMDGDGWPVGLCWFYIRRSVRRMFGVLWL